MPQSLTQLPKTADIVIGECKTIIRNHMPHKNHNLTVKITDIIRWSPYNRELLAEFEKYGVSFEAAIEYCVHELEDDLWDTVGRLIYWNYNLKKIYGIGIDKEWNIILSFSKSAAGRKIAEMYIEKFRNCNSWEELYIELHMTSKFQQDMKSRVIREIEQ